MAWIDDRIWCHPKLRAISDKAHRVYVNAIAYSAGMGSKGVLSTPQQKLLGARDRERVELIAAGLWDALDDGAILIHDWDEHNSKRDERRAKDSERKRVQRMSAGQSNGTSAGQSAGRPHVEGSEGSDGSEGSEVRAKPKAQRTTTDVGAA